MNTATEPAMRAVPAPAATGAPDAGDGIELLWPQEDQSADAALARRGILVCQAGQAVARNAAVPPNVPAAAAPGLRLGEGVCWDPALQAYVALRAGHVRLKGRLLEVLETLEWTEMLEAAGGPLCFAGDVILRRGVADRAVLRGARDITVQDCIEAADVQAGRDITVHHGVCGKEKGVVRAAGRLVARFLSNARVRAGGDVVIENEIDTSCVQSGGELRVDRGTILAGHVTAVAGIRCHTAGSPSGVKTILELGVSAEQQAEIRRVSDAAALQRQKARDIRTALEPLLARRKTLTAAQKEKATEFLYLADQHEQEAQELAQRLALLKRPLDAALEGGMRVASALHPGVIIRYPGYQACVAGCVRGPLTVKLLGNGAQRMIAAVDDYRGTKIPLQPGEPHPPAGGGAPSGSPAQPTIPPAPVTSSAGLVGAGCR